MNLTEMLTYTAGEYLDDRTDLVDGDPDSLWSDSFLVQQFNSAQRMLAKRAWCIIEEGVAPAGVITLVTDVKVYALNVSVLRVLMATPTDQEWPLYRTSDAVLRTPRPYTDMPFDINNLSIPQPGRPLSYSTDAGTRELRIFRTPSATENGLQINLKVARLPITFLTVDTPDGVPEVPEDYHEVICRYAAGRALLLPNVDGSQRAIGRDLLDEFEGELKAARRDRQRAEMEPSVWGFSSSTSLLGGGGTR
jgi:hypothetical protein